MSSRLPGIRCTRRRGRASLRRGAPPGYFALVTRCLLVRAHVLKLLEHLAPLERPPQLGVRRLFWGTIAPTAWGGFFVLLRFNFSPSPADKSPNKESRRRR